MSDKYEDLRKIIKEELLLEGAPALEYFDDEDSQILDNEDRNSLLDNITNKHGLKLAFANIIKKYFYSIDDPIKKLYNAIVNDSHLEINKRYEIANILKREGIGQIQSQEKFDTEDSKDIIFEQNFDTLLATKIDFAPGIKISLAGLCLVAVVTDNSLKENTDLDSKQNTFIRVMSYLYKFLRVNKHSISELKEELEKDIILTYTIELVNPDFDTIKKSIYSAGGFAYEIAFSKLLDADITGQAVKNMNRISPLYSYYIASLNNKGRSTAKKLRETLREIFESGNNAPLFNKFSGEESYDSLITKLVKELNKKKIITDYVKSIKNNISEVLTGDVKYEMHDSPTGIFDIIASANNKYVKFDIKTTINTGGISEPTGQQIHKWKEETVDTLYYGIVSIIINEIDWNKPYLLVPANINGGAVSHNAIAQDLSQLVGEELNSRVSLTYFSNNTKTPGKTIGIFKIPVASRSSDFFKISGDNSESLSIVDIAKRLNDQGRILPKTKLKQLSNKMISLYEKILENYPDHEELSNILVKPIGSKTTWHISSDTDKIESLEGLPNDIKTFLSLLIKLGDFLIDNRNDIFSKKRIRSNNSIEDIFINVKIFNALKIGNKQYTHTSIQNVVKSITKYFESESQPNSEGESNLEDEAETQSILSVNPYNVTSYGEIASNVFFNSENKRHIEIANTLIGYVHKIYYLLFESATDNTLTSIRDSYNVKGNVLLEKDIRLLVRKLLQEADKKSYRGSHPEESYGWSAKEEDFMFDKPGLTTWEEDRKRVKEYLRSMGILAKDKKA